MKIFINKNYSKNWSKEKIEYWKEQTEKAITAYEQFAHGKMWYNNVGDSCIYYNNRLIVYKTRESGALDVRCIIDNRNKIDCASIPTTRTIQDIEKQIKVHPKKKKHFFERYIARNCDWTDVMKTVGRGIRSVNDKGAIFYFKDNLWVTAVETNTEILLTTAVNVSMFSEKHFQNYVPNLHKFIKDKLEIDCTISLRDNYKFMKWLTSKESVELDRVLYNLNYGLGGYEYRSLYTNQNMFNVSRLDAMQQAYYDKGNKLKAYYYSYPTKEIGGWLPLEAIEYNIATSSYDIVFSVDDTAQASDQLDKIMRLLNKKFGLNHYTKYKSHEDLIRVQHDSLSNQLILILDAALFTRNNDERFNPRTEFEIMDIC